MVAQKSKTTTLSRTELVVISRPIDSVRPDPINPRKHTRDQTRRIATSIEAFGFTNPILINAEGQVIAGHGRLAACRMLGMVTVPTISLPDLSPKQARGLQIADNQLTDLSAWDDRLLAQTLEELSKSDLSFSIEATGFEMGEIDWRITGVTESATENDSADTVPGLGSKPISQVGDLWLLGKHRLLCGSCLEPSGLAKLMEGERARMIITDPPYNVPIQGHVSGLGIHRHREFAMASGEMTRDQFGAFLNTAIGAATQCLMDGGMAFVFIDWRHVAEAVAAIVHCGGELKNICAWVKHNAGMGSLYRSGHELVVVSKHGSGPHVNNVALGRHGRHRSNVWRYPGANSPGARKGKEGDLLSLHPTPKPVSLVADAILDCSNRNEVILDSFIGSGTTIMAAERVGRRCYGLEIDPLYVDTSIRRFQALTGEKVRHEETGQLFDDRVSSEASEETAQS